ncbi:MAG: glycoside hydrolase family 30 protein [Bdellovibrionota bacterium]
MVAPRLKTSLVLWALLLAPENMHAEEIPLFQCAASSSTPCAARGLVQVFETTFANGKINPLVRKPSVEFSLTSRPPAMTKPSPSEDVPVSFEIDPQNQHQQMMGFGAAFTESCTMQWSKLPAKMREDFIQKMFSKANGAGFDIMRLPMGSTDFSNPKLGNYTYDDSPNNEPDPEFRHFSMARDEATFAMIRQALKINPRLKIMASPWSAPAWMKTSKQINGGELEPEYFQVYANYFVRALKEYRQRGIPVETITIQNEPYFDWEGVPTMGMSAGDQKKFIGEFLGPTLEKNGLNTKIFAFDHNWSGAGDANEIIDDKIAGKYVGGAAFHCYEGTYYNMLDTMRPHPGLPIMQTECTAVDDPERPSAEDAFHSWTDTQTIGSTRAGPAGAIAWNLCLDEKHGPNNWAPGVTGCQNCRGLATVDFSQGSPQIRFEPEYWALAQLSKFIDSGFRHVAAEDEWKSKTISIAPFVNKNGRMVLGAQNTDFKPATIEIRLPDSRSFTYKLPARSAVTFLWSLAAGR